jgi:hypothetical protein
MSFEDWLTKHADVKTFDDTEGWLHDLCVDGLNMGDDILMYMQKAYEAGRESLAKQLREDFIMSTWVELSDKTLTELLDGTYERDWDD